MAVNLYRRQFQISFNSRDKAYLRLDQDQVDEQHHKVVLDILVRETFAARALRQTHSLSQRTVIGLAVRMVERVDGKPAFDTDWHCSHCEDMRTDAREVIAF
jgi:hypothetical protein